MTGTFKFRLEKVWEHRRRVVDEHSRAVALADRKVAELSHQLSDFGEKIARHSRTMIPVQGHELRSRDLIERANWLDHLYGLQGHLKERLQIAIMDQERCRSRLNDVWRDLEVLSRLRERQLENWRTGQIKIERSEMDEIGQIRAFRHGVAKGSC